MHIAVIGSGKIGATAARLFVDAGHDVTIANSRGPETLTDIVEEPGERMNYYVKKLRRAEARDRLGATR
jgi:predicted dinucleotide-binding enzyme